MEPILLLATPEMQGMAMRIHNRLCERENRFSVSPLTFTEFANGEIKPSIPVTVRHRDVYVIHSLYHPDTHTSLMQLLLTIDAVTRASADSITLVLPYMSYMRQDRKDRPRVPISARLIADLLQISPRVERILTLDLHSDQAQGFFAIPVDNLYGSLVHQEFFKEKYRDNYGQLVVVSPDHGGIVRARRFAKAIHDDVPAYMIDKRRIGPNKVEVMNFVGGDIAGRDVILYDDMIDTGGSIIAAARVARERGATAVYAVATHGLFSPQSTGLAEDKFAAEQLNVVITESIPRSAEYMEKQKAWLTVLSIDRVLAEAIYQSATVGGSVSSLFALPE